MTILIPQAATIRKEELDLLGGVKIPLSEPAAVLMGKKYIDETPGIDSMGIWECSPGRWQRTIMQEEFAHFIKGSARFIPVEGEPIDVRAGDTIWFPANTTGVWEITEDVRKVYVIIDRPSLARRLRLWLRRTLLPWLETPSRSAETSRTGRAPAVWRSSERQAQ